MSENDVRQVAAYIKQELVGIDPILADPREFLILAWDRRSAEMFREALTRLSASGAPVPGHVPRDLDEWLSIANPSEDPSVALVEAVLRGAATHLEATAPSRGNRPIATHALLICACVTLDDAPTWLIYDDRDGGIMWGRIPDGAEANDVVDAQFSAGGHANPGDVLAWLQGKAPDPWASGDGWGDDVVLAELGREIRGS